MGERASRGQEIYSATPEEIREYLGLPEDASHAEVVAERWKQFKASELGSKKPEIVPERDINA